MCNRLMADIDAGLSLGSCSKWPSQDTLIVYRGECPQCTAELPPIARSVTDAEARQLLFAALVLGGWPDGCTFCPIVQTLHHVPMNPKYHQHGRRGWKERQAGEWPADWRTHHADRFVRVSERFERGKYPGLIPIPRVKRV